MKKLKRTTGLILVMVPLMALSGTDNSKSFHDFPAPTCSCLSSQSEGSLLDQYLDSRKPYSWYMNRSYMMENKMNIKVQDFQNYIDNWRK
jgi:hypothetical protein